MRVGLLIYGTLDTVSGGYLYDRMLVRHLRNQRDLVKIVSLPWRSYGQHIGDNFSRHLLHQLRELEVDVLIQDELNHPSLAWLNHIFNPPYPILSLVHHLRCDEMRPAWQNKLYRFVERHYLENVDGFIFNSTTTQSRVDQISSSNNKPRVIATPGSDRLKPQVTSQEIEDRAHQSGPLRLIFLGNLIPRKGLHTLITALSHLPEDYVRLDIVGNKQVNLPYTRRIVQQIQRHGLGSRVRFLGVLEDSALVNAFNDNQVLVVPSSYEGFGIVYLEGMGFGLPAIGTTYGAAGEIILPNQNGYLIAPGDSTTLANLLYNLHHDRRYLAEMGLNAKDRYNQFPGWDESMMEVRNFLSGLI